MLKELFKKLIYYGWVINGFLGFKLGSKMPQKLTVLITYYNPTRIKHINHQIRNLLKCEFIERIVISCHNPEINIEKFVHVSNAKLVLLNQKVRRGCGYRWIIADQFSADYLIVMDDDLLLFPWQVRKLFTALLVESETPHGFAGMMQRPDGTLEYHQKVERSIDYLSEVYAVTGKMLKQYIHLKDRIQVGPEITKSIEFTADFVIVSRTGNFKPRMHSTGHLLRCPTFNQAGVAVHREQVFLADVHAVSHALDNIELQA